MEQYLKEELFGCMKYVKIPLNVLEKMPVRDRRTYISLHNIKTEQENAEIEGRAKKSQSTSDINQYTDMAQQNAKNAKKGKD